MAPLLLAFALLLSGQPDPLTTVDGKVLDSSTNQPIANARVILVRSKPGTAITAGLFDMQPAAEQDTKADRAAVLTGVDGGFRFRLEELGPFLLFADAQGYVRETGVGPTNRYESKAGAPVTGIVLKLTRTVGISGRVIDEDTGQPVPGFTVMPFTYRVMGSGGILWPAGDPATTDESGRFRLEQITPGDCYLEIRSPLGTSISRPTPVDDFRHAIFRGYRPSWYPRADRIQDALPVTLVQGVPVVGVDIKIAKTRTASIRGRLLAADESSAEEVSLALISIRRTLNSNSQRVITRGKLKPGSEFQIDRLAPGTYWLIAEKPGRTKAEDESGGLVFQVGEENQEGLDVVLRKGVRVSGRVRMEGREPREGEPALPDGETAAALWPLTRALIRADSGPVTVSSTDGSFAIEGVMPDQYHLSILKPPRGYKISETRYNRTVCPHAMITIDPGGDEHRLEVTLAPADAAVVVTATDGSDPVPGASVLLFAEPFDEEILYGSELRRLKADKDGRANATDLLPGTYRVIAYAPDARWEDDPNLKQRLASGQEIRLSHKQTATVQIRTHAVP